MKTYLRLLFALSCLLAVPAGAQSFLRFSLHTPQLPDSTDLAYYGKNHPVRAAGTVVGLNLGVWSFDRFVCKSDFAYINAHTIRENLKHGFVWDNDCMGTNMFLHPYHGNLYFNAARSNGFNFWQSSLFAFGGSAMWELFMENEFPSTNDILATPIGGAALGEVAYRMSDLILDDRQTGGRRFGLEAAAFLVSPMRGLTRLLNGDARRHRPTSGKQFGIPDMSIELSAGIRTLELKDELLDRGVGLVTEFNMEYGDRYDADGTRPYDYFHVKANLNLQKAQPLLGQLNVVGRLTGTELVDNRRNYLSMGLYQHFDYYDSDTISDVSAKIPYKFCTPASLGVGFFYKRKSTGKWDFSGFTHLNAVLLGGALSDYYKVADRNYNLGSGYSTKNGLCLIYKKDVFALSTSYEAYHFFTWKGYPDDIDWNTVDPRTLNAQGDKSSAILHAASLRLDFKLRRGLYLTSYFKTYARRTHYHHYEDVHSTTTEGRLMLTFEL